MREQKYHVYLTADEQSRVIQSLIRLKNELLEQGKYTDAVDDVLCKVLSAKRKRNFFISIYRSEYKKTDHWSASGLFNGNVILTNWKFHIIYYAFFRIQYPNHLYSYYDHLVIAPDIGLIPDIYWYDNILQMQVFAYPYNNHHIGILFFLTL